MDSFGVVNMFLGGVAPYIGCPILGKSSSGATKTIFVYYHFIVRSYPIIRIFPSISMVLLASLISCTLFFELIDSFETIQTSNWLNVLVFQDLPFPIHFLWSMADICYFLWWISPTRIVL